MGSKITKSRGKPGLSRVFREFNNGDAVTVIKEPSVESRFPLRIHGLTGIVTGKVGSSYVVELKTKDKLKKFIVEPVHLKRIKQ